MSVDLRLPNINAKTDSEKIAQLTKYLYQMTEQLNFSFNTIETNIASQNGIIQQLSATGSSKTEEEKIEESYSAIKSMIIKSADFVETISQQVQTTLDGSSYVTSTQFGTYQESTNATLTANSTGITQLYSYTAGIRSDFGDFDVNNQSYIKTGLLYYDNSQPVYGVGVGILDATTDGNGRTVIDKGNLLSTFTAEEIAFWGNDTKLAYITPTQVYFPSGKLTAYNATITGNITANDGNIGGWHITSSYIDSTVAGTSKRLYLASASDSSSYWMGAIDANGTDVFHLTKLGFLYARGADIGGTITAESGTIGGWSLSNGRISKTVTHNSTDYVAMMNAPASFGSNSPSDYVAFGVKKGNNFVSYIDYEGDFHSKRGDIGGWGIDSTKLSKSYTIGGHTYSASIIAPSSLSSVSGMVAFGVSVDNTYKAYIDYSGRLYANDAYISGEVHATSGSFTGSVTATSGSFTGSIYASGGTIGNVTITDTLKLTGNKIWLETFDNGDSFRICDSNRHSYLFIGQDNACLFGTKSGYTSQIVLGSNSTTYDAYLYSHNGNFRGTWSTQSSISVVSDANKKNTIEEVNDSYDVFFDNLRSVTYKFNDGTSGRLHTGFIAQEVKQSLDNAGLTTNDFAGVVVMRNDDGSEDWYLRYEEFISINTWQIQKLKARVAELERKLQ